MDRGAVFDRSGRYRYRLHRAWNAAAPTVAFVLLNPSTADAGHDDPTLRRCLGFARRWGFGRLEVVNLFALRATDPAELRGADDPVGPRADRHLRAAMRGADVVVIGWGRHGGWLGRDAEVSAWLPAGVLALGVNVDGRPRHPLYVPGDCVPRPFVELARCPS